MRERLGAGKAPREIAEEMCDRCLAPDTGGCGKGCDNMSGAAPAAGPDLYGRAAHAWRGPQAE